MTTAGMGGQVAVMPHDHGHHHHHIDPDAGDRRVALAVGVNLVLTLAQIVGGLIAGSMALIADAVHNLSDAVSLIIAFAARKIARRGNDQDMTFGYARVEIVSALVNYTTLIVISLYLLWRGAERLINPPGVEGWIVVALAGVALVVDVITALLTWRMAKDSVNIRAAFLHNVADALSSVAVIVAGTLILLYDWRLVDPLVTIGIAVYILWHAASEIRPVVHILMLGRPPGVDLEAIRAALVELENIEGVHHLHLWQIDEKRASVEAHLVLAEQKLPDMPAIVREAKTVLRDRFGIVHSTLEVETTSIGCANLHHEEGATAP